MNEPIHPFIELLRRDTRYPLEAYQFVREALSYAQDVLELGTILDDSEEESEQHLTGPQLCMAIQLLALEQFGLMARTVLNNWGIGSTSDIGNIVYNLIDVSVMRKSQRDRREDFDDVFDFEEAFDRDFQISVPKS